MKPADLTRLHSIGAPTLSPDGTRAVFALTRPDLEKDTYAGGLWTVPTDGSSPPRPLTRGEHDSVPVHSPDGRWIAFLRPDSDDRPQIHVLPVDGGEPWKVTDHPLGASAPAWSPDSTRLAHTARVPDEGRYTAGTEPGKEPPRRITTLKYRLDGLGFHPDRPQHVFVTAPIDPDGEPGTPVRLTTARADHAAPAWSTDGTEVLFTAALHESADTDLVEDVWACAPQEGAAPRRLTHGRLSAGAAFPAPDGTQVFLTASGLGEHDRDFVGRTDGLWRVPLDGGSDPVRLTDEEDGPHVLLQLHVLDDAVLLRTDRRGAVHLLRVPLDGGDPETLVGGPVQTQSFDHRAGVTVAVVADGRSSGELVRVGPEGAVPLTSFMELEAHPVTELTARAPDGHEVHGWVAVPRGEGPHPVVLMIHGGPFAPYGHQFFDETQVLVGAGYAVVLCNPRGSSGYGMAHARAIIGNVGEVSAVDLLAFLDAALEDERLDPARVGVMGGSHGGYMTTWMAAHHGDRFRAAIPERALTSIDSFEGSSDIGSLFPHPLYGPPEGWERQSPLAHADRIEIPTLIMHSEQDWRCPVEQAQRLYVRLRRRREDTEFLLFPGEGHELSRSGLPSHRIARFEAVLDWWARHL
ncbi:S9 family peptidase [Nocardiopsis sp. HNM0947]|uniref:S9 family peptidase n=1 Tax=Nocardiopsis coralli TaxID=2772213 RepID=A0ABR9P102_9ACTN|nr:S9 family peptidase [Nocardiopsis coralli]MBE2997494.1 S9 family peptidase [Nocardiopsis coralli]